MSSSILKQFKCDLGLHHEISKDVEKSLYEKAETITTHCLRCNAELELQIDPRDSDYYIVIEK